MGHIHLPQRIQTTVFLYKMRVNEIKSTVIPYFTKELDFRFRSIS